MLTEFLLAGVVENDCRVTDDGAHCDDDAPGVDAVDGDAAVVVMAGVMLPRACEGVEPCATDERGVYDEDDV